MKAWKASIRSERNRFRKTRAKWFIRWCKITQSKSQHWKMVEIEISRRFQRHVKFNEEIWQWRYRKNQQKRFPSRAWTVWTSFKVGGAINDKSGRSNEKEVKLTENKIFQISGNSTWSFRDDHALNSMLSRCGVLEPGPVNYVKLLERFQDRSDQGKLTILYDQETKLTWKHDH